MSEFHVQVSVIKDVQKHPNADSLSIATINGYPIIFKTSDFNEGDLAVHIPIDSIVPDTPEWAFLQGHNRIKAKKLRGIFSMGLVIKPQPGWKLGQNVQKELGIKKYEPKPEYSPRRLRPRPPKGFFANLYWRISAFLHLLPKPKRDPGCLPIYTDIEGYRKYKDVLVDGEEVVLNEKLHGQNGRWMWDKKQLWVGSHNFMKLSEDDSTWWEVARKYSLAEKLKQYPGYAFYGEVYGDVQDLMYGAKQNEVRLALFDIAKDGKYLDYDEFKEIADKLELPTVPLLYRGPWSKELLKLAEGKTTFPGADHIREGFVVKPVKERFDAKIGRVILKMVGEGYLLRKNA